jgi:DsbC/DsbD-like thiol-disulfide interchange protein
MRWPDRDAYEGAFHDLFPSWENFWKNPPKDGITPEVATPAPWGEFLKTMRAGQPDPKIKVR